MAEERSTGVWQVMMQQQQQQQYYPQYPQSQQSSQMQAPHHASHMLFKCLGVHDSRMKFICHHS
jgi:hypothetical protein